MPPQLQEEPQASSVRSAEKPKEEIKLKGRENFKIQMSNVNKVNFSHVVLNKQQQQHPSQQAKSANQSVGSHSGAKLTMHNVEPPEDFEDWYSYALKLEDSIKIVHDRCMVLSQDYQKLCFQRKVERVENEDLTKANL